MKKLVLGLLAALSVAASFAVAPAKADWAPSGSYQRTCRGINFDGDMLTATCRTAGGRWHNTYLSNADNCDGNIENNNGQLECGESGWSDESDWRGGAPNGPYVATCTNIRMDGYTLRATCQRRNGSWAWASLEDPEDCDGAIQNWNGRLACGRGRSGY
ncbi:MAG: CVNH domain-containing protein [Alphaproteobacteria bacterium]|nr:CVNH domain-containing protein [Alphaproteobacteria bacterium]MBV9419820.1 CVNH domain-containing protein [Alphaproteobacteria bacterium]MBV9541674.1 CVNH domain-containing protein [Alphaproteobacteria bacterium]MBV9904413.1 CVNH domain-containing protein [Alphaproteobacteria bacterium]